MSMKELKALLTRHEEDLVQNTTARDNVKTLVDRFDALPETDDEYATNSVIMADIDYAHDGLDVYTSVFVKQNGHWYSTSEKQDKRTWVELREYLAKFATSIEWATAWQKIV
jgi:hypothetical protein